VSIARHIQPTGGGVEQVGGHRHLGGAGHHVVVCHARKADTGQLAGGAVATVGPHDVAAGHLIASLRTVDVDHLIGAL
jgi:hypothetical protein